MSLTIRHVTPGLGVLPQDITTEACSGLVGVALGIAQAQTDLGERAQVLGWNPYAQHRSWNIGAVEAHATAGWHWAKFGRYDFRVTAPMILLASRIGSADVMHAYTDPHLLLSANAKVRLFHIQTPVPDFPSRSYSWLVNRADAVLCCSAFIRDQFLGRVDFPAERVFEVTNGVDERRFEGLGNSNLWSRWGIRPDQPVVLFAGALVPEKGLLYLLKAASRLVERHRFQIVVAGSAGLWLLPGHEAEPREDSYTRMVREAADGLPVTFLGAVSASEMPELYSASSIFVCPSTWDEPFGMVACEAMAAGKPVIASRRGGLTQIVEDGSTGLLVPSEDAGALASALDYLLSNEQIASQMGHRAKVRARQFSWTSIAARLAMIYEDLGARSSRHSVHAASSDAE